MTIIRLLTESPQRMIKKLMKLAIVMVTVLFLCQLVFQHFWSRHVLDHSQVVVHWKTWKPPVHLLTAETNLHDLLPLYIRRRILPKRDITLVLFSSNCPLYHQIISNRSSYSFDRSNVDFFFALLTGTFSRVVWVYPFIRNPIHTGLPMTNEYGIGKTRLFIPLSSCPVGDSGMNSRVNPIHTGLPMTNEYGIGKTRLFIPLSPTGHDDKRESVHFSTICLCKSDQQHCSLPHLSHLAGPIPAELCDVQHKFIFNQVFDFIMESNLMSPDWMGSMLDGTDPMPFIVAMDMTYFGKPTALTTRNAGQSKEADLYGGPQNGWDVQSKDILWENTLLSKLLPLYNSLVLTSDSWTSLRGTRSMLDLVYLLLSPSFSLSHYDGELTNKSFSYSCTSSPDKLRRYDPANHPGYSNLSQVHSCCLQGFHLLLQFVNLTEPSLIVDAERKHLLFELWFWLCSDKSTGIHRSTMWTVCLTPDSPASHELVFCPRQAATFTGSDREPATDSWTSQTVLLLDRIDSLFRHMPRPRVVVINSESSSPTALREDDIFRHICRLVDSVFPSESLPIS